MLEAGFDPARLPPGQYLTQKWPVLHVGSVPAGGIAGWRLRVWGEVENEVELGLDELRRLPATDVVTDIHCVTRWSRFDARFRGVRFADLARPTAAARFVVAHAAEDYRANLPLAALDDPGSLVAYEADGEPARARARRTAPPGRPDALLLEERQVAPGPRGASRRRAGHLGAPRLFERRRPLGRGALLSLRA